MGDPYDHEKRLLRRRFRASRSRLSPEEVVRLSAEACARVTALPSFARAHHVVAYAAMENELDPAPAVAAALRAGKSVYLPVTGADRFERTDANGHPPAGGGGASPLSQTADDVVFLVPGLAFDARGVRLGRGAGWYDRVLAQHPHGTRIGLAYEFQVVPDLPEAPWDVRMHAVVTEARLLAAALADRALKETRP
jgi:5-formyltetrahydrofolate cyclo-ligase